MLRSMTGFGEARRQDERLAVTCEVRTVNNRHLKINTRCPDGYAGLEPLIEAAVRGQVQRGSVQVHVRVDRLNAADVYRLNEEVLRAYRDQLETINTSPSATPIAIEALLSLPGVVQQNDRPSDATEIGPLVEAALKDALANLATMRGTEGSAMAADLTTNLNSIATELAVIEERAPLVGDAYRDRLTERLQKLLAEHDVAVEPADILREVAIFSERSDIAEEVVRLKSHLDQFHATLDSEESTGRRLDFLTQEMVRETNTIGSKANDSEITRRVIEIKSIVERIREMVQNVE